MNSSTLLSPSHPQSTHLFLPSPLSPGAASLPSPLSPGVESVEFNEEEVLKTCQVIIKNVRFLTHFDKK